MAFYKISGDIINTLYARTTYKLRPESYFSSIYPINLESTLSKPNQYYSPLDKNGIPMKNYKKFGLQYNPTRVAAYALGNYNRYLDGETKCLEKFLKMANWFLSHENGLLKYHFNLNDIRAPWISAMAQGEALSVLSRAYIIKPEHKYLRQALRAAKPLKIFIEDGGLKSKIEGFYQFLEEHPAKKPPHTLNGFLYSIVGILDLMKFLPEIGIELNIQRLLDTISKKWNFWDAEYWSTYDLNVTKTGKRNFSTIDYHNIHIILMRYIGVVTERNEILKCSTQWEEYQGNLLNRIKAIIGKIRYRLEVPAQR